MVVERNRAQYVSLAEEALSELRQAMKKDPVLIVRVMDFIATVRSGLPEDQPGDGPVLKDYYTADPLTTIQHGHDPFHIGRTAEVDRDMDNLSDESDLMRQIVEAHRNNDLVLAKKLEDILNAIY